MQGVIGSSPIIFTSKPQTLYMVSAISLCAICSNNFACICAALLRFVTTFVTKLPDKIDNRLFVLFIKMTICLGDLLDSITYKISNDK